MAGPSKKIKQPNDGDELEFSILVYAWVVVDDLEISILVCVYQYM